MQEKLEKVIFLQKLFRTNPKKSLNVPLGLSPLLHKPLRPGHDPVKRRMIKEFAVKEIEYVTAHVLSSQ